MEREVKRMNDDLISRSSLKTLEYINKGNFNTVEGIREWIDNAPTVEQSYQMPKDYIKNKLDYSRPQGEWITWEEAENYIASPNRHECSCCHDSAQVLVNGIELLSDFCPNCGADMRGGRE